MKLPKVQLRSTLKSSHPWIFEKNVRHNKDLTAGALVEIVDKNGKKVGTGLYNRFTPVAIRRLTGAHEVADQKFIYKQILTAKKLRNMWLPGHHSYRVCHSEADGLSGLIIDKFENVLLVQPVSAGWLYLMDEVCTALKSVFSGHEIKVMGNERHSDREKVDFSVLEEKYRGPSSVVIEENGVKHKVRFDMAHKTGFFLDQRENRQIIASLTQGKSLLDLCCNTGGFSLSAAKAGCEDITAVDLDEKVIAVAKESAKLNEVKVDFRHVNAFDFLRNAIQKKQTWDVVVLDPAKLVGHKSEYYKGVKQYEDFNRLAMQVVTEGGILLTCSCSGLIDEKSFLDIVFQMAFQAKREAKVVKLTGADVDHPYTSVYPEGRYLKAAYLQINKLK